MENDWIKRLQEAYYATTLSISRELAEEVCGPGNVPQDFDETANRIVANPQSDLRKSSGFPVYAVYLSIRDVSRAIDRQLSALKRLDIRFYPDARGILSGHDLRSLLYSSFTFHQLHELRNDLALLKDAIAGLRDRPLAVPDIHERVREIEKTIEVREDLAGRMTRLEDRIAKLEEEAKPGEGEIKAYLTALGLKIG